MAHFRVHRRQVLAGAALALAGVRPGHAAPGPLPFELIGGKIYLPATVAGRPVHAVLDSGAAFNGLDAGFAAGAGVRTGGLAVSVRGVQGGLKGRWAKTVAFSIGGRAMTSRMLVLDYRPLSATVQHPVEALLGADFLRAHIVEIDFEGRTLTLHDRAGFAAPGGAQLVPLSPLGDLVTAPVTAEGAVLQAIIDTGCDVPLIVAPGPAARAGLLRGRPVSTTVMGGIGGTNLGQVATLRRVAFGPAVFESVPLQSPPRSFGGDAIVGLGLLGRYRVWLDMTGRRMWLARNGDVGPFKRDALGLYGGAEGDGIRVSHVAAGSPAARSGVAAGDFITHINGQRAALANRMLVDAPPGTRLSLTLANGQVRNVVMGAYY